MVGGLATQEVRVRYRLTSHLDDGALAADAAALSDNERARGRRFLRAGDQRDFIAAHALLRRVLSSCAPLPPAAWTFIAAPGGKPALTPDLAAETGLSFSLAHTDGLVACAVAHRADVGVDVERVDRATKALDLARRYFAPREAAIVEQCADERRTLRFIEIWTLKEAFIKATGAGLAQALDAFAFDVQADGVTFDPPPGVDRSAWQFALSAPSAAYRLAVAVGAAPPGARRICVEAI